MDDMRSVTLKGLGCCGIREMADIYQYESDPHMALRNLCQQIYTPSQQYADGPCKFRFILFSQARAGLSSTEVYGVNLCAYIQEHKLGAVVETDGWHTNPNSGNMLKAWVWTVDHKTLKAWAKGQGISWQPYDPFSRLNTAKPATAARPDPMVSASAAPPVVERRE